MTTLIKRGGTVVSSGESSVHVRPVDLISMGAGALGSGSGPAEPPDPKIIAKQEAEIIVRTAHAEAQAVHDKAYEEGFRAGAAEAAQAASGLIEQLENAIALVVEHRNTVVDEVEPQVLKLCIEAVEKVIRHEIRTDPRVVDRSIKTCLRRVKDSSEVCVRVSPDELAEVRTRRDELMAVSDGLSNIQILDDRRVSPGGCIVETGSGSLDARIDTQINRLQDKLMERCSNDRRETGSGPDAV